MTLIKRFGYYLGGFSIGLVLLAFFLNGKKVSCDYGPNARTLKNINSKNIKYVRNFESLLLEKGLDSLDINHLLKKGSINFTNSDTRKKPCAIYNIEGDSRNREIGITVENCDSIATITSVYLKE